MEQLLALPCVSGFLTYRVDPHDGNLLNITRYRPADFSKRADYLRYMAICKVDIPIPDHRGCYLCNGTDENLCRICVYDMNDMKKRIIDVNNGQFAYPVKAAYFGEVIEYMEFWPGVVMIKRPFNEKVTMMIALLRTHLEGHSRDRCSVCGFVGGKDVLCEVCHRLAARIFVDRYVCVMLVCLPMDVVNIITKLLLTKK